MKLLVDIECSAYFLPHDHESRKWFINNVLMNPDEDGALYLHSNELGETIGRVRVLAVHDWPPTDTASGDCNG